MGRVLGVAEAGILSVIATLVAKGIVDNDWAPRAACQEPAARPLAQAATASSTRPSLVTFLADAGIHLSGEPEVFEVHNIVKR